MSQLSDQSGIRGEIKNVLELDCDILFAYLFGSRAAGQAHFLSDIDVACFLEPGDMEYYLKKDKQLLGDLAVGLHTSKIDLVLLNAAPLVLQFKVISDGNIVFSRDEQGRVDYETNVLYRYFDLKPYLDEYHQLMRDRMKRAG